MGNFMSVVTCSADRDDKLILGNDSSTPQQGQGMFSMFTSQEESEQEVRELAQNLDLDKLRVAFFRYAGPDEQMDRKEFGTFSKRLNLSEELGQRKCDNNSSHDKDSDDDSHKSKGSDNKF